MQKNKMFAAEWNNHHICIYYMQRSEGLFVHRLLFLPAGRNSICRLTRLSGSALMYACGLETSGFGQKDLVGLSETLKHSIVHECSRNTSGGHVIVVHFWMYIRHVEFIDFCTILSDVNRIDTELSEMNHAKDAEKVIEHSQGNIKIGQYCPYCRLPRTSGTKRDKVMDSWHTKEDVRTT